MGAYTRVCNGTVFIDEIAAVSTEISKCLMKNILATQFQDFKTSLHMSRRIRSENCDQIL
jgi:predicted ATP-dependent protease